MTYCKTPANFGLFCLDDRQKSLNQYIIFGGFVFDWNT